MERQGLRAGEPMEIMEVLPLALNTGGPPSAESGPYTGQFTVTGN
jgi:hypothetical protein